jgi:hypothetical protein
MVSGPRLQVLQKYIVRLQNAINWMYIRNND